MFTKYSVLALCAAASVNEVAAKPHRHQHPKKDIVYAETDTVVFTEYTTVTVYADEVETAAYETPSSTVTTTTTTPIVDPAPTQVYETAPVPTSPTTTLVTSTRATSSAVEVPTVEVPTVVEPTSEVVEPTTTYPTTTVEPTTYPTTVVEPTTTYPTTSVGTTTTSASQPTSTGGSKRGAAFNDATLVQSLINQGSDFSWCYNWGAWKPSGLDIPWYPMMWGPQWEEGWFDNAQAAIDDGIDALLSFNEPDIASQANIIDPAVAATKHQYYFNQFAGKVRISAPAISSSQDPNMGIDYLKQFLTACNGNCPIDFCVAHWYGPGGEAGAEQFLSHLKDVHVACDNKPIWVTEFRADDSDANKEIFMSSVTQALDSAEYDFVEKYSYFMVAVGELLQSATELTTYGKTFAGLS